MNADVRGKRSDGMTRLEITIVIVVAAILVIIMRQGLFPSAPTRSMVSRVRTDHRSLAVALEAYFEDQNAYPGHRPLTAFAPTKKNLEKARGSTLFTIEPGIAGSCAGLTTPVAYSTAVFLDPYAPEKGMPFGYYTDGGGWILLSPGPDKDYDVNPTTDYDSTTTQPSERIMVLTYDPTNGTVSGGDLWRVKQ